MAFYQKYRAKTFGEMVGQGHVIQTLLESVKGDKLVHAYLLTGPRGIGKTSTARLLAKAINCERILAEKKAGKGTSGEPCNECDACRDINEGRALDVMEIDAASHTGVDDIRELIEKARLSPTKLSKKVYIIDEVHMLSKSAFNALLKTLEEPPAHAVFIMATTETHKIPATILSRAQRYDFRRAEKGEIIENLQKVAKEEGIEVDDKSLDLIAVSAQGGHRDALSLLEQVASLGTKIDIRKTQKILGSAETEEVYKFIGAIFNGIPEEGLKIAHELFQRGLDMSEFNRLVIDRLRAIFLYKISKDLISEETAGNTEKIKELSSLADVPAMMKILNVFVESAGIFKEASYPLLPIEMAVVRAAQPPVTKSQSGRATENIESGIRNHESREKEAPRKKQAVEPVKVEKIEQKTHNSEFIIHDSGQSPTVPVPVFEMTKDIWEQVIKKTKESNSTLAALLRDAKPLGLTDNALTLGVKFKFHKDRISEPKHTEVLAKSVAAVTGNECRIICKITDFKTPAKDDGGETEDLEKVVGEIFEV